MQPIDIQDIEFELVGEFPFWQATNFDNSVTRDDISNAIEFFMIKLAARYRKHFYIYSQRVDPDVHRDYLFKAVSLMRALSHLHADFKSAGLILRSFEHVSIKDLKQELERDFNKPGRKYQI